MTPQLLPTSAPGSGDPIQHTDVQSLTPDQPPQPRAALSCPLPSSSVSRSAPRLRRGIITLPDHLWALLSQRAKAQRTNRRELIRRTLHDATLADTGSRPASHDATTHRPRRQTNEPTKRLELQMWQATYSQLKALAAERGTRPQALALHVLQTAIDAEQGAASLPATKADEIREVLQKHRDQFDILGPTTIATYQLLLYLLERLLQLDPHDLQEVQDAADSSGRTEWHDQVERLRRIAPEAGE